MVTKLSSKGQVVIPKELRSAQQWQPGQELLVVGVGDGILLKKKPAFKETNIEDVAACLRYAGPAKTLKEMEAAISKGILEKYT